MELLDDEDLLSKSFLDKVMPPWYKRFLAAVVDIGIYWFIIQVSSELLGLVGSRWFLYLFTISIPLYKILAECFAGQTVGKKVMGLRVVSDDKNGSPLSLFQANKRFWFAWPMYAYPLIIAGLDNLYQTLTGVGIVESVGNFFYVQLALILLALVSAASYLWHPRQQSWYDRLSNTLCIVDPAARN